MTQSFSPKANIADPKRSVEGSGGIGGVVERVLLGDWGSRLRSSIGQALCLLLAALMAVFLSYKAVSNQITETQLLHEDRVSLADYISGNAARPFAYRALTPLLMRGAEALGVPSMLRALPGPLAQKLPQWCALATAKPTPSCDDVASYFAVGSVFCFVFLMGFYALCLCIFGRPLLAICGAVLAFLTVNAILLQGLSHLYDFGGLMFTTLMLICLQRGWNIGFTLILPLAFLTKETLSLYAGVFFMVNLGRIGFARNVGLFVVQAVSFLVLHGAVRAVFAANPGAGHEYYLPDQIHFFTEQISITMLILLTTALLLVFYRFPDKDMALRRASVVIVPWFVLFMIGGEKKELRVIFEVLPLLLIMAADSLARLTGAVPTRRVQD